MDAIVLNPTEKTYQSFYQAYAFFNSSLFDSKLPNCLITMQRSRRSRGFFASKRFGHRSKTEIIDEIALNPKTFIDRTDREIISTLVHEMVHLWQHHFGKPGRRGYHNKQWAAKMQEVGLMPSRTGEPGGKQTGQAVTHYIDESGRFAKAWNQLVESGYRLDYQDRLALQPSDPKKDKVRYACPTCSIHVWGKPNLEISCIGCRQRMV